MEGAGAPVSPGDPGEPASSFEPPAGSGAGLGVGGILRAAFDVYRQQALSLWTIVVLIVIPVQVLEWVLVRISLSHPFARGGTVYTNSSTLVPALAVAVLGFLSAVIAIGALSKCVVDAYTGHPTDWRHSVGFASEHWWPLAVLSIVTGLLLTIAFVLFVIPGIYFTVVWCVAVPALVFERIGPFAALGRSSQLIRGNWWSTFAVLVVGILTIIILSYVIGLILGAIASSGSVDVVLALAGISRTISALLAYPILAALTAVIYVELRARKEGIDPRGLSQASAATTSI
jgi:hypothetical protein